MSKYRVTKCICHRRSFEEIKSYAAKNDIDSVGELIEEGYCSTNCGLCIPYVTQTLDSGQTEFTPGFYQSQD